MARRHWGILITLRVAAALTAVLVAVHAVVQGAGSQEFWRPCGRLGYLSGACSHLQYEAPSPGWTELFALWPIEAVAAGVVLTLALVARTRAGLAAAGLACVLFSNVVVDYVITPAFNGGFTSADSPPYFGTPGAVLLGVASLLFAAVAVLPSRRTAPAEAVAV